MNDGNDCIATKSGHTEKVIHDEHKELSSHSICFDFHGKKRTLEEERKYETMFPSTLDSE